MARTVKEICIFISSPSDVKSERAAASPPRATNTRVMPAVLPLPRALSMTA